MKNKQDVSIVTNRQAIIVLGMHRSGTSALSGALHYAGADFGKIENLFGADRNINPKGYWEHKQINALNNRLLEIAGSSWDDPCAVDFLRLKCDQARNIRKELLAIIEQDFGNQEQFGLKEPRIGKLLPFWKGIFEELGIHDNYVIIHRHPYEVSQSLAKRDGFKKEKSYELWMSYMLGIEKHTYGKPRTFVSYASLLADWYRTLERIRNDLGICLDKLNDVECRERISGYIEPALRHTLATDELNREQNFDLLKLAYMTICEYTGPEDNDKLHDVFGKIRENYTRGVLDAI